MPIFDQPDFCGWFRATYRADPGDPPALRLGECQGCGSSGVPILHEHCLICVAADYGGALIERRIAEAIRGLVGVFVHDPPEAACHLVSQVIHSVAEATRHADDEREARHAPMMDDQPT